LPTAIVVHTLPPYHPEWKARVERAVELYEQLKWVKIILLAIPEDTGEPLSPRAMVLDLTAAEIPLDRIRLHSPVTSEEAERRNIAGSAGEVELALDLLDPEIEEVYIVSNWFHLWRLRINWWAIKRAREVHKMRVRAVPCRFRLGVRWLLTQEVPFFLYSLWDPTFKGRIAWRLGEARRQGKFKAAGE